VRFFEPLIGELRARGHEVTVTAREFSQTKDLLDASDIEYTLIGAHQGRSLLRKTFGLLSRSWRLAFFARGRRFDVAFGHNSNDLAVAAWLLRIPYLTVYDYEHAKLSHRVNALFGAHALVPDVIPLQSVLANGTRPKRAGSFPGLKEHVYLTPDSIDQGAADALRREFGIRSDEVLVVVRPPATMSAYHRFENALFDDVLARLVGDAGACVLIVPRTPEQRAALAERFGDSVVLPERAVDGTALIVAADLVLSAGGTMNREAAVLGTPAYTVFAGTMGAVDRSLIGRGLMVEVTSPADVVVEPKTPGRGYFAENRGAILDKLQSLVRETS
jgi:hypothetical protein